MNTLITEGLRIPNVTFLSAERKERNSEHKSGVIIVTCKFGQDKNTILKNKKRLAQTMHDVKRCL